MMRGCLKHEHERETLAGSGQYYKVAWNLSLHYYTTACATLRPGTHVLPQS